MKFGNDIVKLETGSEDYQFLEKIAPKNFIGIISDQVQYWRWVNQTKLFGKVKSKVEELGIEPQEIAPKFLINYFSNASLEEDEDIQDLWVNLLLNESQSADINIGYIDILANLEPIEAVLLSIIYEQVKNTEVIIVSEKVVSILSQKHMWVDIEKFAIIIRKLYAMQLIKPASLSEGPTISFGGYDIPIDTTDIFTWTELGLDFMAAVSLPTSGKNK